MTNHDQDPSFSSVSRRGQVKKNAARIGISALSTIVGAGVGAGFFASSAEAASVPRSARPATAAEVNSSHEAVNPLNYLKSLSEQMIALWKRFPIDKAENVGALSVKARKEVGAIFPGCDFYNISVPSAEFPGRYDYYSVAYNKADSMPVFFAIRLGNKESQYSDRTFVSPTDIAGSVLDRGGGDYGLPGEYNPLWSSLMTTNGKKGKAERGGIYIVSDGFADPGTINYQDKPQFVAKQYEAFFKSFSDQLAKLHS